MTRKQNKAQAAAKQRKQKSAPAPNVQQIVNTAVSQALARAQPRAQASGPNSFLGNLGQLAGNGISKIFGLGAYRMSQNSLYKTGGQVPHMQSNQESVIFRHREYIGDIAGTTAFSSQTFSLNPGLQATFPYLNSIASNFQEYKFRGLIMEYKSTSSVALSGSNTAMGTVSLVAQYRADATPLTNKTAVLNEMWAVDGRPSEDIILPVECSPKENPLAIQYVRTGALPANQDVKLFDLATVTVATQGMQTGVSIVGELWISYEVELYKPVLTTGGGLDLDGDVYSSSTIGVASTTPLGTSRIQTVNTIGLVVTPTAITFPAGAQGTFLVTWWEAGTVVVIVNPILTSTNLLISTNLPSPFDGTTSNRHSFTVMVLLTGDSVDDISVLTLGTAGTIPTGAGYLRVVQVPNGTI